jgi:hypothetical protein
MKPNGGGMLCIECLEKRIGRRLTAADFTDALVKHYNPIHYSPCCKPIKHHSTGSNDIAGGDFCENGDPVPQALVTFSNPQFHSRPGQSYTLKRSFNGMVAPGDFRLMDALRSTIIDLCRALWRPRAPPLSRSARLSHDCINRYDD